MEERKAEAEQQQKEIADLKIEHEKLWQNLSEVKERTIENEIDIEHLSERNTQSENLAKIQPDRKIKTSGFPPSRE